MANKGPVTDEGPTDDEGGYGTGEECRICMGLEGASEAYVEVSKVLGGSNICEALTTVGLAILL